MTKFKILARMKDDDDLSWREWVETEAHTAKAAMNTAYLKHDGATLGVVAMQATPLRSWKPQQIRTENVVRLHFGDSGE